MFTVFRMGGMQPGAAFDDPAFQDNMPVVARFLLTHAEYWFLFCFLMSVITLVAAIGLLRRHNWARILFVVMMVLGVIWNLGAPWLSFGMMPDTDLGEADPMFSTMFTMIQVFTFVFAFAVAGVLGWIAWRLCRPGVRAEFTWASSEPPLCA